MDSVVARATSRSVRFDDPPDAGRNRLDQSDPHRGGRDINEEVDNFYREALAAGGRDNGAPSRRPEYHPTYYGAFVLDPDGHNVEAVFHGF
jgi:catechol 2,3-dioxygenase-like lactoylglutathione lyase family enzyme